MSQRQGRILELGRAEPLTEIVRALVRREAGAEPNPGSPDTSRDEEIERLLEALPFGCALVDEAETILYANRALHRVLGRAPRTLPGYRIDDLGLDTRDEGGADDRVVELDAGDGSIRTLRLASAAYRDSRRLVSVADVTERSELEARLAVANDHIARARRLEILGTTAGGLAHDLNNLLVPILAGAQLLEVSLPPDDETQGDVEVIITAARRAVDLVSQLLQVARGERDRPEPVDLAEICREVVTLSRPAAGPNIEFREIYVTGTPRVLGTKTHFHQIVFNLCKNAVAAMPDGGAVTLTVDPLEGLATGELRSPRGGPFVRLVVADEGVGMGPEVLDRIFDPLYTTKGAGKGSGLGLAMVHELIERLDGSVSVRSQPGHGARFTVVFPVHDGVTEAE